MMNAADRKVLELVRELHARQRAHRLVPCAATYDALQDTLASLGLSKRPAFRADTRIGRMIIERCHA
jgi:hypothetical protein